MTVPFLHSSPGDEPVVLKRRFKVDRTTLFRAWTTSGEIKQWFGAGKTPLISVQIDVRVGGNWRFAFAETNQQQDILSGEYVEVVKNSRLVFTWQHSLFVSGVRKEQTNQSLVTLNFLDAAGDTQLSLKHEQIVTESGRRGVAGGWNISLEKLAEHVYARTA